MCLQEATIIILSTIKTCPILHHNFLLLFPTMQLKCLKYQMTIIKLLQLHIIYLEKKMHIFSMSTSN